MKKTIILLTAFCLLTTSYKSIAGSGQDSGTGYVNCYATDGSYTGNSSEFHTPYGGLYLVLTASLAYPTPYRDALAQANMYDSSSPNAVGIGGDWIDWQQDPAEGYTYYAYLTDGYIVLFVTTAGEGSYASASATW